MPRQYTNRKLMNRRQLSKALALAPLSCLVLDRAIVQAVASTKGPDASRPFRVVNVTEDGRRVMFFFDFACPFCAKYYEPLLNWSSTVPKGVQTMFIPVVNMADTARKQEQIIAAKCYYAAFKLGSKQAMARFASSVYESYASVRTLTSKDLWAKAVKDAGIDIKKFGAELKSADNDFQIQYAARKCLQYGLRATPSVGVGGKYVITPDDVLGDDAMFFNILNGLTSEIL